MAETKISDVIVPEVFSDYTIAPAITRSRFFKSGLVRQEPALAPLLDGGGKTFAMPKWADTTGESGDNPSEGSAQDVDPVESYEEVARRQFRVKAWGANDLSAVLAGSDGIDAAAAKVMDFWAGAMDKIALQSLLGCAAATASLTLDISTQAGAAGHFSDAGIIDAQALIGENGTVGRGDEVGGDFVALVVHPKVYAFMRKKDLIDFVPISGQDRPLPFYMNMAVIVDKFAPLAGTSYTTFVVKAACFSYGLGTARYLPTEVFRDPKKGMGVDELYTRRAFAMHPAGFKWKDAAVRDGVTPTDAELATAGNWELVAPAESSRFVALKHKVA